MTKKPKLCHSCSGIHRESMLPGFAQCLASPDVSQLVKQCAKVCDHFHTTFPCASSQRASVPSISMCALFLL